MCTDRLCRIPLVTCVVAVAVAWCAEAIPTRGDARALASVARTDTSEPPLIVYQVLTDGLWTVQRNGESHRSIVPGAGDPAWAPDGSRLLYTTGSLFSARPDGSDQRLIIDPVRLHSPGSDVYGVSSPAWAPNGRRVAFVSQGEDANERSTSDIFTASLSGSHVRRLRSGRDPAWSADGRRLYFMLDPRRRGNFSSRIATMRRDGTGVRVLLGNARGYRRDLEISPDGRKLAYLETRSAPGYQASLIRIRNLGTGRTRTIPWSNTGSVSAIAWTPGGRIAYIQNTTTLVPARSAPSPIETIRPDGTGRRRELVLPYDEYYGTWATELAWQPKQH